MQLVSKSAVFYKDTNYRNKQDLFHVIIRNGYLNS